MDDIYTHSTLNSHVQEFTDHLNSIDDDIKWTTEGKVITCTQSEEKVNIDTRTERALAFFDTKALLHEAKKFCILT